MRKSQGSVRLSVPRYLSPMPISFAVLVSWLVPSNAIKCRTIHKTTVWEDLKGQFDVRIRVATGKAPAGSGWSSLTVVVYNDDCAARTSVISTV